MGIHLNIADLKGDLFVDIFEDEICLDIVEADGKIRVGENFCEEFFRRSFKTDRGPDVDGAMALIDGQKEGEPARWSQWVWLMSRWISLGLAADRAVAEGADARARVDDDQIGAMADF